MSAYKYYIIYKPYMVLSQFSPVAGKKTLADFFSVPKDVYPIGRLDVDSEGLLLLTNDKSLNEQLLHPRHAHEREYWAQVEGLPTPEALAKLQKGVSISIEGKVYDTKPCKVATLPTNPPVTDRNPPIRFRANIPTTWLGLTLTEGKNRQVRKMTASVNLPTLRLIRWRIERLDAVGMISGDLIEMGQKELFHKLKLK